MEAVWLLKECVKVAKTFSERRGYKARAALKLSGLCPEERDEELGLTYMELASKLHAECYSGEEEEETEESYEGMVPWMLW